MGPCGARSREQCGRVGDIREDDTGRGEVRDDVVGGVAAADAAPGRAHGEHAVAPVEELLDVVAVNVACGAYMRIMVTEAGCAWKGYVAGVGVGGEAAEDSRSGPRRRGREYLCMPVC